MKKSQLNVGLFVTCLIDITGPSIGFASVELLEKNNCKVSIPSQSCCGQPAYNNGNRSEAIDIARATIAAFEKFDYLVCPSASCAGMIKYHYPPLFEKDPGWKEKADHLASKTYELTDFLYNIAGMKQANITYEGRIIYHESCSALREMKLTSPRALLQTIKGAELLSLDGNEECCGFGGLFSVKYDEISNAMVETKANKIMRASPDLLTGVDQGCLMNISGKLKRKQTAENEPGVKMCHIAELLNGNIL